MKLFSILFLLFSLCYSDPLTLIGASGNRYSVPASDSLGVDIGALMSSIQINSTQSNDTLKAQYSKNVLRFCVNNTSAMINGKPVAIGHKLCRNNKRLWLESNSAALLMSSFTGLVFTYDAAKRIMTISKLKPSEPVTVKTSPQNKSGKGVIVIDPGHGGKDPGAIGVTGVYEKTVVLAIAKKTAQYITENSEYSVYLTRSDDRFIPLRERTEIANSKKADLFLSIHTNSVPKQDQGRTRGYTFYFLSDAKSESDQRIALFENAVLELEDQSEKSDVLGMVLKDMINNEYLKESQDFAIELVRDFKQKLPSLPVIHTGVSQANFFVLNGAQMPSVLAEIAFISNKTEEKLLADPAYQQKYAASLGQAVINFRDKQRKNNE